MGACPIPSCTTSHLLKVCFSGCYQFPISKTNILFVCFLLYFVFLLLKVFLQCLNVAWLPITAAWLHMRPPASVFINGGPKSRVDAAATCFLLGVFQGLLSTAPLRAWVPLPQVLHPSSLPMSSSLRFLCSEVPLQNSKVSS